jgi:3-oxoadipate enol-lactonase
VTATDRRAPLHDTEIAYSDEGSGPVAVYAHGLTASRAVDAAMGWLDWSPVVAAGRRLISYDARGHGSSGGTKTPELYTWPALAGDLLALLDDRGAESPVSALGSSMGTGTLLHAALLAPERFDRLVLAAPPTAWESRAAQGGMYLAAADLVEAQGLQVFAQLAGSLPRPPVFADLETYPPTPDVREDLLPTVLRGAAASDLPRTDDLRGVQQPTLVLAWADDPGHPVSTAERLVELLPDAHLHVARTPADLHSWGGPGRRLPPPPLMTPGALVNPLVRTTTAGDVRGRAVGRGVTAFLDVPYGGPTRRRQPLPTADAHRALPARWRLEGGDPARHAVRPGVCSIAPSSERLVRTRRATSGGAGRVRPEGERQACSTISMRMPSSSSGSMRSSGPSEESTRV